MSLMSAGRAGDNDIQTTRIRTWRGACGQSLLPTHGHTKEDRLLPPQPSGTAVVPPCPHTGVPPSTPMLSLVLTSAFRVASRPNPGKAVGSSALGERRCAGRALRGGGRHFLLLSTSNIDSAWVTGRARGGREGGELGSWACGQDSGLASPETGSAVGGQGQ